MASDLINLAAGAGVALLIGNALHHKKRADDAEDENAKANAAATNLDARIAQLAARKPKAPATNRASTSTPSTKAQTAQKPRGLSRAFDQVFAARGMTLPVPYLRALAYSESNLDPAARTGEARGLLQVVPVVLRDYNKRAGTHYQPSDLYRAETNVEIASSALRTIIESYQKNHPNVPAMREDWTSRDFVALLSLGWCAGWSEAAGVGRVVTYLGKEWHVVETVNLDAVAKMAKAAGASKWLADPRKVAYAKRVTVRYFDEVDRDAADVARAVNLAASAGA